MSAAAHVLVLQMLVWSTVSTIVVLGQPELRGAQGPADFAAAAPATSSSGLLAGQGHERQPLADENVWSTPDVVKGFRHVVWTSSAAKYELPYKVWFGAYGRFAWEAPFKLHVAKALGVRAEMGEGIYLTAPRTTYRPDGSWETHYFSSNRFTPHASNGTNCCCEYLGGDGRPGSFVLADYFVKMVPNSMHLPMWDVCAPYVRKCPVDNATANAVLGKPFIEIYGDVPATSQGSADAAITAQDANVGAGGGVGGGGGGVASIGATANFLGLPLLLVVIFLAGFGADALLKRVLRLWAAQRGAMSTDDFLYLRADA